MIRHYIYFIIYELLDFSNGFFIFLFCLFFFYRMVIIRTHFFSILILVIRKDNGLQYHSGLHRGRIHGYRDAGSGR